MVSYKLYLYKKKTTYVHKVYMNHNILTYIGIYIKQPHILLDTTIFHWMFGLLATDDKGGSIFGLSDILRKG